jgi:cell division protein FtsL
MNAAARILNESLVVAVRTKEIRKMVLSKQMCIVLTLLFCVLTSALLLITVTDKNRIAIGALATLEQNQNNMLTTFNQLLLEKNTWSSPQRIESIAASKLSMALPDPKKIILIND